ncbi:MAG: DnaB-like helicase N-terminal domain-containing protein [Victivallaceae bacterium]
MTTATKVRVAPHSKESEMMVLGCMLTSFNGLQEAAETLDDADFYFTEHKIIFQALKKSHKNGKAADVHLICEDLKAQDKLKAVGGVSYIVTLAQYAGTSAYIEEYVDLVRNKAILRDVLYVSQEAEKAALEDPENANHIIEELSIKVKSLEGRQGKKIPIIDTSERLKREDEFLGKYRGQKYLGLRVKTIEEFNENFLGLRGLMLLAAAPNVGKTALTVQTAIEVLATEKDACLAYISLEMSEEQIFRRMLLNLSGLNFRNFVFGSQSQQIIDNDGRQAFFEIEEIKKIKEAENILRGFGSRLQIIDQSTCPYIDSRTVVNYVDALKQRSKCSRAIVIIDYSQVWPVNINARLLENEADKWRIGGMKKIRDALNDDPVIVISEARKPSGKDDWGGDMSDVMGAARGTYTPDVVMLLSQLKPKSLSTIWVKNDLPKVKVEEDAECSDTDKDGLAIKNLLAKHGIAICKLEVPKTRDGMQKFSTLLEFHFHKNTFKKVNWEVIKNIIKSTSNNNPKTKNVFGS